MPSDNTVGVTVGAVIHHVVYALLSGIYMGGRFLQHTAKLKR